MLCRVEIRALEKAYRRRANGGQCLRIDVTSRTLSCSSTAGSSPVLPIAVAKAVTIRNAVALNMTEPSQLSGFVTTRLSGPAPNSHDCFSRALHISTTSINSSAVIVFCRSAGMREIGCFLSSSISAFFSVREIESLPRKTSSVGVSETLMPVTTLPSAVAAVQVS